jgi:hypothetical protein
MRKGKHDLDNHYDHAFSPADSPHPNDEVTAEAIPLNSLRGRQLYSGIEKFIDDRTIGQRGADRQEYQRTLSVFDKVYRELGLIS